MKLNVLWESDKTRIFIIAPTVLSPHIIVLRSDSIIITGIRTGGKKVRKNSDDFSINDAIKLAQSPAGKQLFAQLQAQNPSILEQAMTQAANGDYEQVKATMANLLKDPAIQALLRQMGG
jgi:hypothetical protein